MDTLDSLGMTYPRNRLSRYVIPFHFPIDLLLCGRNILQLKPDQVFCVIYMEPGNWERNTSVIANNWLLSFLKCIAWQHVLGQTNKLFQIMCYLTKIHKVQIKIHTFVIFNITVEDNKTTCKKFLNYDFFFSLIKGGGKSSKPPLAHVRNNFPL